MRLWLPAHRPALYALVALVLSGLGVSCDAEVAAPGFTPPPKSHAAAKPYATGDAAPAERAPFVYRTGTRRDPFRSYLLDAAARSRAEHSQRHMEETETYALGQYRLSGVLTGTSQPKAMVEDPTGRGFVVRIGTRLGKAGGRVARIDSQGIQVIEESLDPTGRRLEVPISMLLPTADDDAPLPRLGAPP